MVTVVQDDNMVKVCLIKTIGCEGCKIMENILSEVKFAYKPINDVDISIVDKDFINPNILREENITDFPTTIIYTNDYSNFFKIVGTVPYINITSKIEEFRNIHNK